MKKHIFLSIGLMSVTLLFTAQAQQELTFDDQFNGTFSAKGFGPTMLQN